MGALGGIGNFMDKAAKAGKIKSVKAKVKVKLDPKQGAVKQDGNKPPVGSAP